MFKIKDRKLLIDGDTVLCEREIRILGLLIYSHSIRDSNCEAVRAFTKCKSSNIGFSRNNTN